MISNIRPGVLGLYEGGKLTESIFVAGGFAEVTAARCTVLADQAMAVEDLDRGAAEQKLKDAIEGLEDAQDDLARRETEKQIAICQEILRITGS
jgi:F-type H+-transporting ATPase subunit epsilon